MAITVDWVNQIISVPRADMNLVQTTPFEIRELDINAFRLELKDLEDDEEGIVWIRTHVHTPPSDIGGVDLARVVRVINGYTITFEDGQYAVNIIGGNSNISDVTNLNQVQVRSANSAGLTFSKEIEDITFEDARIWINTIIGTPGTLYPIGTPGTPVQSYADALAIADSRRLAERYHLTGPQTIADGVDISSSDWTSNSRNFAALTVEENSNIENSTFKNISLSGYLDQAHTIEDGSVLSATDFFGDLIRCGLKGTIALPAGASTKDTYIFFDCYSLSTDSSPPVLDCNSATDLNLQFASYTGPLELRNYTDASNVMTFDMLSGELIIDSSCTAGTVIVRGNGTVVDNSGGAVTIVQHTSPTWSVAEKDATLTAVSSIADTVALLQKYQENRSVIDTTTNTLVIYDDDNTTPILAFSLLDSGGSPSTVEVAEKLPI